MSFDDFPGLDERMYSMCVLFNQTFDKELCATWVELSSISIFRHLHFYTLIGTCA